VKDEIRVRALGRRHFDADYYAGVMMRGKEEGVRANERSLQGQHP
jgi:hypothetical protein